MFLVWGGGASPSFGGAGFEIVYPLVRQVMNHVGCYCLYYQAQVKKELCWFMVAVIRSCEHVAFDRTIDKAGSVFEFFVPPLMQKYFEEIMACFLKDGVITYCTQMDNRLLVQGSEL